MSPLKPACRLTAVLCGAWLLVLAAHADESSTNAPTSHPIRFFATLKKGEFVGDEQVQRIYVTSGTNEFLFVVPSGLRIDTTSPEKILIVASDYSYSIVFQITSPTGDGSGDAYREVLSARYPGSKVTVESSMGAGGRNGPSFDLQWHAPVVGERFIRAAFIPSPAGTLEFTLIADPKNAANGKYILNGLTMTFLSNENGKIEAKRHPGAS